jgi:hypothetical protein
MLKQKWYHTYSPKPNERRKILWENSDNRGVRAESHTQWEIIPNVRLKFYFEKITHKQNRDKVCTTLLPPNFKSIHPLLFSIFLNSPFLPNQN